MISLRQVQWAFPLRVRSKPALPPSSQATNNQQPTTNNQQPTTNNHQPPTTNNQQPTTNNNNNNCSCRCSTTVFFWQDIDSLILLCSKGLVAEVRQWWICLSDGKQWKVKRYLLKTCDFAIFILKIGCWALRDIFTHFYISQFGCFRKKWGGTPNTAQKGPSVAATDVGTLSTCGCWTKNRGFSNPQNGWFISWFQTLWTNGWFGGCLITPIFGSTPMSTKVFYDVPCKTCQWNVEGSGVVLEEPI